MTRTLYLDTFSGISGDMFLGALVDCGLDLDTLAGELKKLPLDGYRLTCDEVYRGAFLAKRLKVLVGTEESDAAAASSGHGHEHDHHHHSHGPADHAHEHAHSVDSSAPTTVDRSLRNILQLLASSELPDVVRTRAESVFQRLGEAEAKVHGMKVEDVHFHEVGAVDSIVDIVGACLGLHLMGIEEIWSSPLTLGSGFAKGAHGTFPLPAPATLEVLRGFPVNQRDCSFELTTPTGAAIASTLAAGFGPMPAMKVERVGYGAGDDRPGAVPNLLRVVLGQTKQQADGDRVVLIEANVDDMNPQWIGHLIDRALEEGALDVTVTPVLMKKSRPGHLISVLVSLGREAPLEELLFRESTTLGIRKSELDRVVLERRWTSVQTPWGEARVKIGERDGQIRSATPEFEDLKQLAQKSGLSIKELHESVMDAYRRTNE